MTKRQIIFFLKSNDSFFRHLDLTTVSATLLKEAYRIVKLEMELLKKLSVNGVVSFR